MFLLGAVAVGAWLLRKKPVAKTTDGAILDASELYSPNAANARFQIQNAVSSNNPALIRQTAEVIGTSLKMPKTADNLRAWATMVEGGAVAGEVGAAFVRQRPGSDRRPIVIPDWLKFQATQSKLSGDPAHIRATAETMKRFGYRHAAKIHLSQL